MNRLETNAMEPEKNLHATIPPASGASEKAGAGGTHHAR
jgi:hypothetical protein